MRQDCVDEVNVASTVTCKRDVGDVEMRQELRDHF